MPIAINCKRCGKVFSVKPSHVSIRVYCSMSCMKEAYTNERLKKICETCGKEFEVYNNNSRKDARFCSKECMGKGMSGENHANYKHGYGNKMPPAIRKAYKTKYYETNLELCKQRAFLGKAKRRSLRVESGHTFLEWIDLLKKHDNICYYCGVRMTKKLGLHQRSRDHLIPISRGGSDDISNIVPACRSCNSAKGTKTYEEWKRVTVIETALDTSGTE